jgi:hypothetical protein
MPNNRKEIYLLLTYTGTMPSKLIKLYTRKQYTHVSIALDRDFNDLYSFGRKYLWYPLIGGFVKEDPDSGVYAMFKNVTCKVYKLSVTNNQYDLIKQTIDDFKVNQKKYNYNFLGLFGVIINKKVVVEDRYFCSEFVAKVLEDGGVDIFNKPAQFVSVDDFTLVEELEEVFSGDIKEYRTSLNI